MANMEKVTIDTIANGAAIERVNLELDRVLKNILDPNTSAKVLREINLKIKIKPTEDRGAGSVEIQATSKLAPVTEHVTQVYIGTDQHGQPEASEIVQPVLPFGANVTPMREGTND